MHTLFDVRPLFGILGYVDPWDMLNNFRFHAYAQKSLFIGENGNAFFGPHPMRSKKWMIHTLQFKTVLN